MAKPRLENASKTDKAVTLIAANSAIAGDISFEGQLYVNGRVQGNIVAETDVGATLVVSEEGSVNGEIRVPNVVINGNVQGNVYSSVRLELAPKAQVSGSVYYTLIEMQLGAVVDGQLAKDENLAAQIPNVHALHGDAGGLDGADEIPATAVHGAG